MNAHTWIPSLALLALFALMGTASAGHPTSRHESTMQMSKKDARAIVSGRRTQWNSLYWGEPAAPVPPAQRAAPSPELPPTAEQERRADVGHHHHVEFLDLVAATGELCLAVVVVPVVVVAAVVVFPLHCLSMLH
jgi:hypothetical protein